MMLDKWSSDASGSELAMKGARMTALDASVAPLNNNVRRGSEERAVGNESE
jgi:hypothetical protein